MKKNINKLTIILKRFPKASLCILLALIIGATGVVYSLLTATDEKENMFTMGNLSVALYEDDLCFSDEQLAAKGWTRGQYDWYDHETGELANDSSGSFEDDGEGNMIPAGNGIPDFADTTVCGAPIVKTPYVENTSDSGAYIFIAVGIPTEAISRTIGTETSIQSLVGTQYKVKVTGYAFQQTTENYTKKQMWDIFSNSSSNFKNMRTNNVRVGVFKIVDPDTGENGNWEFIEQFNSTDNYNYYVYAYKNVLPGTEQEGVSDLSTCRTNPLFTKIAMTGFNSDAYQVVQGKIPFSTSSTAIMTLTNNNALDNDPEHRVDFTSSNEQSYQLSEGATLTFKRDAENGHVTPYIYFDDGNALIGELYYSGSMNGRGGTPWSYNGSGVPSSGTRKTFNEMAPLIHQWKPTYIYGGLPNSNSVQNNTNYNTTIPPMIGLYCTEPEYGGTFFLFGFTRMELHGAQYYVDYTRDKIYSAQGTFYSLAGGDQGVSMQKWLSACITSGMLIGDFWFA